MMPRVIKQNGSRQPFDEDKLRSGFMRALEKRPVGTDRIEAAISHIRHKLLVMGEREVSSQLIGEQVMQELRELDQVAYVRFASVYRDFKDVREFRDEIDRLESEPSAEVKKQQIPLLPENGKP